MIPSVLIGPLAEGWEPLLPSFRLLANCGHTIWLTASSASYIGLMDTKCATCGAEEAITGEMAPWAVDDLASIGIHTTSKQLNMLIPAMLAHAKSKGK